MGKKLANYNGSVPKLVTGSLLAENCFSELKEILESYSIELDATALSELGDIADSIGIAAVKLQAEIRKEIERLNKPKYYN